jgi:hypothetical protein
LSVIFSENRDALFRIMRWSRQGISRMNWAWATSFDHIWRSPSFPMWLTMAAAGFFSLIALITLLRAEKSVANVALTVITLLAVGTAIAATIRGYGPAGRTTQGETRIVSSTGPSLPALSCVDGFAGDAVLAACEKVLFGSVESTAAAVSYAAAQIGRLTALGDVNAAEHSMTPELRALRRTVERDRYGLMAQVFAARDRCTPTQCSAFRSLTDSRQIVANMEQHTYDAFVTRYAASWNSVPANSPMAMLPPSMATGRPTNADFPTAASTPAVSIMTPEPGAGAAPAQRAVPPPSANATPSSAANASLLSPRPTSSVAPTQPAAAKKPAAPKRPPAAPPTHLAPPPPSDASGASTE